VNPGFLDLVISVTGIASLDPEVKITDMTVQADSISLGITPGYCVDIQYRPTLLGGEWHTISTGKSWRWSDTNEA